jgi:hypothetical protein
MLGSRVRVPQEPLNLGCTLIAMKNSSWKNEPGQTLIEVTIVDGVPTDEDGEIEQLTGLVTEDGELVINWLSSGYYEPARMYGGPDNLGHPAEGDEERTLDKIYFSIPGGGYYSIEGKQIELPPEVQKSLFDKYSEKVDAQQ